MRPFAAVAALASTAALATAAPASAASLLGVPLTPTGLQQLTLEAAVGVAYLACKEIPEHDPQDGFRAVVTQGTTTIEVCRTTGTTSPTSFSNQVELVRISGPVPATVTFHVHGENYRRETFRSAIDASLAGETFVIG